ncbi:MAG TPA: hypothetical protein VFN53_11100, partial [Acidobacteriaceae bacterium]|nr:hypothetical protein [Acidobacteriaceae bacterium]
THSFSWIRHRALLLTEGRDGSAALRLTGGWAQIDRRIRWRDRESGHKQRTRGRSEPKSQPELRGGTEDAPHRLPAAPETRPKERRLKNFRSIRRLAESSVAYASSLPFQLSFFISK